MESNVSGEKKGYATLSGFFGFLPKLENIKFVLKIQDQRRYTVI